MSSSSESADAKKDSSADYRQTHMPEERELAEVSVKGDVQTPSTDELVNDRLLRVSLLKRGEFYNVKYSRDSDSSVPWSGRQSRVFSLHRYKSLYTFFQHAM